MNTPQQPDPRNTGHGHVAPRPDGMRARCGGPAICKVCQQESAALEVKAPQQPELPALPVPFGSMSVPGAFGLACDGFTADQMRAYAQAAVLADLKRRKVVAWRYLPSPTWGEYVITQDPKVAEDARACGIEVEEMTVDRHSKVEDKTS